MRISAFVIGLFIVLFAPVMAYSHCHNNAIHENPMTVRGNEVWPPGKKNDDGVYEIEYWINKDKTNMPPLETDVKAAAAAWSDIAFQNRTIKFKYTYVDRLNLNDDQVLRFDDKNVVGWYNLNGRNGPAGACETWNDGNRIDEMDILLNYYKDFTTHANRQQNPSHYCLLEVATHEFGHGAGLKDVYYEPSGTDSSKWCRDYRFYTMNGHAPGGGSHWRESLRCEDKYALDQKYSYGP